MKKKKKGIPYVRLPKEAYAQYEHIKCSKCKEVQVVRVNDKSIYTVWSHINNAKYIPEQLFTSTRIADVREFMRKEIIAFYENYQ